MNSSNAQRIESGAAGSPSPELTPESIQASIGAIEARVQEQRRLNGLAEKEMFGEGAEGGRRAALTLSIALRDELIEELHERRALLCQAAELLAGRQG